MRRNLKWYGAMLLSSMALGCASRAASVANSSAPAETAAATAETAATPAAAESMQGAALVLDVRNADEYAQGHVDGATLIPVTELEQRLPEVEAAVAGDKGQKIVVYCGTGRRAGKALELLQQHGFTNVVNAGGYPNDLR